MTTKFVKPGETLTYTNTGSAISSGDVVVVGKQIGVAATDIAATTGVGELYMEGVFELPKVSTAVIAVGENVIWDADPGAFEDNQHTPATGDVSGCCIAYKAAGNGATTVQVKLNVGIGTVA